jgi:hypothetical protein
MSLPKTVVLTRDGGRYWPAMAFHFAVTTVVLPLVLIALFLAIINPFWFRDSMFNTVERRINSFSRWRGYRQYSIYLGADPKMWHALKDLK